MESKSVFFFRNSNDNGVPVSVIPNHEWTNARESLQIHENFCCSVPYTSKHLLRSFFRGYNWIWDGNDMPMMSLQVLWVIFRSNTKKNEQPQKILTSTNKQSPPPTNQETNENTETAPVSVFFWGGDVSIWWIRHGIFKLRVDFQNATAEVVILESVWKDIVSKEMKCPATWQS